MSSCPGSLMTRSLLSFHVPLWRDHGPHCYYAQSGLLYEVSLSPFYSLPPFISLPHERRAVLPSHGTVWVCDMMTLSDSSPVDDTLKWNSCMGSTHLGLCYDACLFGPVLRCMSCTRPGSACCLVLRPVRTASLRHPHDAVGTAEWSVPDRTTS